MNQPAPTTYKALAHDVFSAAPPAAPQPGYPTTLFGEVATPAGQYSGTAPAGNIPQQGYQQPQQPPAQQYQQPPVQPQAPQFQQPAPVQYPPVQQPAQPQVPAQPAGQLIPQPAPQPSRSMLDRLVGQGQLTPAMAREFRDDNDLMDALLQMSLDPPAEPPVQQPAAANTPSLPTQPTPGSPDQDTSGAEVASALVGAGLIKQVGSRYIAENPDFAGYADQLNRQQAETEARLQELRDPSKWFSKYGEDFLKQHTDPLMQKISQLESQLTAMTPPPHEAWVKENNSKLFNQDGTRTPAGETYHNVYATLQSQGVSDLKVLHATASRAAEPWLNHTPVAQAPAQPQQSSPGFWERANQALPAAPGFSAPGSPLANQGPQTGGIPVTGRGFVDFRQLANMPQ